MNAINQAIKKQIDKILEQCELLECKHGSKLYIVKNSETYKAIKAIFDANDHKDMYNIAKLINDEVAIRYTVSEKINYKMVKDREKVFEYLDMNFYRDVNTLKKSIKKQIKEAEERGEPFSPEAKAKLEKEIEYEIAIKEQSYKYVKDNFDSLVVFETNYEEQKKVVRDHLHFLTKDRKSKNQYLRGSVPNILWYEKEELIERKDKKIENLINKSIRAFGDIYYQVN